MRLAQSFLLVALALRCALSAEPILWLGPESVPRIEAAGTPGDLLKVEATGDLGLNWDLLTSVVLTNDVLRLSDVWCGGAPRRFYRITRSAAGEPPGASNFRLTDHLGRSRELFYYWNATDVQAFVLIFTRNNCDLVEQQLPALEALRVKYEKQGVLFWMVNSNPGDSRSAMANEATRLGIKMPIFQDIAQTVARRYHANYAGEVVCVSRANLQVFYRGAIDDRAGTESAAPTRNYVDEALAAHLGGKPYYLRETKPSGCETPVSNEKNLSYSADIAPILQQKCVTCHSPGNVAPWSMTNHAIVQAYASLIIEEVSSKAMPPWHADPEYGKFKNDISLTVAEERKLMQWLSAGAPRGTGPDPLETTAPLPPRWPAELGEPDLIIRAPEQTIQATGVEPYRYIFVETGLTEDKWLKAAFVRPSNPKVVHHYIVWEGASATQLAVGLAGYVPGSKRGLFPEGSGVLLRSNTPVTFNLHYTPYGESAVDQPELALWFHKTRPPKELITLPLLNTGFTIPPGVRDHEVSARLPFVQSLPYSGTLYAVTPHMHVRGTRMRFEVEYPDKSREILLSVPKYEFHWQTTYELAEPKRIPAGSKLFVTGGFDNSEQNMENPDPSQPVRWGEQSWDEMLIGYFDFTQD